ncbi:hypothetical protein ACFU8W_40915 [Streptomyces sp. NPDC057565]|uniref:hypothetical protein n=1 Tax=Streptomyces sp. NPDC057565 TaxID=3346169 RepID=UPI0036B35E50
MGDRTARGLYFTDGSLAELVGILPGCRHRTCASHLPRQSCLASGPLRNPVQLTSYRLVTDAARNQSWWTLSTRVHTEWEFTSSTTDSATVLPLLDISMAPQQLDNLNRATQRNTDVTLTVGHQAGSQGAAVKGVHAWWSSNDGKTWEAAQMKSTNGVWTAVVKAPKGSGAISLKAEAWDAAGSRVTEEVTRAYIASN